MSYESSYKKLVDLEGQFLSLPPIQGKRFPDGHIFDENKTVKWNREEVKKKNAEVESQKKEREKVEQAIIQAARDEIIHYLMDDFGFTEDVAAIIFNKSNEKGHSSGFCEVLSYANSFGEFAQELFEAEKKEEL